MKSIGMPDSCKHQQRPPWKLKARQDWWFAGGEAGSPWTGVVLFHSWRPRDVLIHHTPLVVGGIPIWCPPTT